MKQLFMIRDYDDKQVLSYYLTNNAKGCERVMDDINVMETDFIDKDFCKDLYVRDVWEDYFVWKCGKLGIKLQKLEATQIKTFWY